MFLMPVRRKGERLPRNKVSMLYCDVEGKVYCSCISKTVYETARATTAEMQKRSRPFATVGLETAPGDFTPAIVEITEQELWALEHISEHAIKTGKLPDILTKHLKPIICFQGSRRETVIADNKKNGTKTRNEATSKVLNRLPYYRERDMEISMPIYKAEQSYPLIILRFLPNKNGGKSQRNILVLDSDGDLAVIKVPSKLVHGVEKILESNNDGKNRNVVAVIYQQRKGRAIDYMTISRAQRKALDTISRYCNEAGNGRQTVPAAARTIISMAEKRASPEVH